MVTGPGDEHGLERIGNLLHVGVGTAEPTCHHRANFVGRVQGVHRRY